jgi:hypothetical protein
MLNIVQTMLQNTAYQLIYTIGLIAVFGLAVGLLNKAFYKLVGYKFGRIVCIATGFIGVPIHEIGHALFCLLFGHKITEIKLYQPNSTDGSIIKSGISLSVSVLFCLVVQFCCC